MILPKKIYYPLILSLLTLLLIGALFLFVQTLRHLASAKKFVTIQGRTPTISVSQIKSWMTFAYINRNFMLPDTVLKQALVITDPHYPHITIESVARGKTTTSPLLISHIESTITRYRAGIKDITP